MNDERLTAELKRLAGRLGFSAAGVAPAVTPPGFPRFEQWLEAGYAGQMQYLADRRDAYRHPDRVLDGARSVLMLAMDYATATPEPAGPGEGRVSRYAWGDADYHDVIRPKLHQLADSLREWRPGATARGVIDTAPLLERDFAVIAGLGWVGKNTLLLNKSRGSYFFLAALVTDAALALDAPHETDHCGTCTACLDACPTDAFVGPRVLDASRCISYLTIEAPGLPAADLREGVGEWLFGCDVCQEVCPWNRHAKRSDEPSFTPLNGMNPVELAALFELNDEGFRGRFRRTPLWRPKRRGLLRNAALVLGATRPPDAERPLTRGLNDPEPLVRAASAWALGRIGSPVAHAALRERRALETEPEVVAEIDAALPERWERRRSPRH